ncbi:MAG TPA: hypothetical protein VNX25_04210 [Verrucomicrobiae bacterium]|nr:hypothetical protein [Verrucomicrobiae bacterium]
MSGNYRRFLLFLGVLLFTAGTAAAAVGPRKDAELLLETYARNVQRLENNSFGFPMFLDSFERSDMVNVDVYGVFPFAFPGVAAALASPATWCDIVSLPPNVKACTVTDRQGASLLTFYLGKKVYQAPEDTEHQVVFRYRKVEQQQGYLNIVLSADSGPYGTRDHTMVFEGVPLDGGKTFVHVSYSYKDSRALRLAANLYFATFGRDKVGFTVTGTTSKGEPVYVGGPRGALERNAVRYYFAFQSYMNTLRYPESSRFGMRAGDWYDLTARFRRQLYDLDREDYLQIKKKEHENQTALQRRISAGGGPKLSAHSPEGVAETRSAGGVDQ